MKYLKDFKSVEDANTQGAVGLYSPHVSIVDGKSAVNIYKATGDTFTCTFDEGGKIVIPTPPTSGQPNDEIWYTSSDGNVIEPLHRWSPIPIGEGEYDFGANIVSNTYSSGKGIIKFDGDVTEIGNSVFDEYTNLLNVIIPDSVTSIGDEAFHNCSSMTTCTIGSGVTSIGIDAFGGCSSLSAATYTSTILNLDVIRINSGDWFGSIKIIHCTDGDFSVIRRYVNIYVDNRTEITTHQLYPVDEEVSYFDENGKYYDYASKLIEDGKYFTFDPTR